MAIPVYAQDKPASASSLQELAAKLLEAHSPEAGRAVLSAHASLVNQELAQALITAGLARRGQSRTQAISAFRLAAEIAEQVNAPEKAGQAYYYWGNLIYAERDYAQALVYLEKSLQIRRTLPDQLDIAKTLNNVAVQYQNLGRYNLSLAAYEESLEIKQKLLRANNTDIELKGSVANSLVGLGRLHRFLGNYLLAIQTSQQGLEIHQALGDKVQIATALINLGLSHFEMGGTDRALESFQQALQQNSTVPKPDTEQKAQILNNIGLAHLKKGNYLSALQACQQSLQLRETLGNQERIARTKKYLAMIHLAQTNYGEALRLAEEVAQIGPQKAPEDYWSARSIAGQALLKQNHPAQAQQYFEDAIRVIEQLRTQAAISPEIKQRFFENKVTPYLAMIDICVAQARHAEALVYAERTKARVLLDLIAVRLNEGSNGAPLNATQPLTMTEAAALLPNEKTALLEFVLANEKAYLFVLHRTTTRTAPELRVLPLAINKAQVTALVTRFRQELAGRQIGFTATAAELYQHLLKPAQEVLTGKQSLVIVPDGILWELPFQALMPAKGRYLLENHTIAYAPSLTALREITKRTPTKSTAAPSLLAFGNPLLAPTLQLPALPNAEQQVRDLGALFGATASQIYLGADASEQRFKAEAANYAIINLATHGIFDDQQPMASRVLLAQTGNEDGALEAHEIMRLQLKAELVVLSACETARGYIGPGEGVIGLTWAFLNAGAPTVVVSQWQVREDSTAQLMKQFYRQIKAPTANLTRAEALRQAALSVMKNARYRHPFYWAGFVLVGKGN